MARAVESQVIHAKVALASKLACQLVAPNMDGVVVRLLIVDLAVNLSSAIVLVHERLQSAELC